MQSSCEDVEFRFIFRIFNAPFSQRCRLSIQRRERRRARELFRLKSSVFCNVFVLNSIRLKTCPIISFQGSAVFDFTGTGPEMYGNCNAPRAITFSAIIYCLRCMVKHSIPLNQVIMSLVCFSWRSSKII